MKTTPLAQSPPLPCSVTTADGYKIDPTWEEVFHYPNWGHDGIPSCGLMEYSETLGWTGYHGEASGPVFKTRAAVDAYIAERKSSQNVRTLAPADNQTPTQNGHS